MRKTSHRQTAICCLPRQEDSKNDEQERMTIDYVNRPIFYIIYLYISLIMSLSSLNYPPLVAISGLGLGASLPLIEKLTLSSPLYIVRLFNLAAYALNVVSVGVPGRLDSEASDVEGGELSPRSGKTLVAPSGWAFSIWGPIFLGELVSVTAPFLLKETDPVVDLLRKTSAPFIGAQIFQSLWCASFRPKYKGLSRYISSGFLAATAFSLSKAHAIYAKNSHLYSTLQYWTFFLPISLHFGWITAAAVVNLNGSVAMQENQSSTVIKRVGHISIILAAATGVFIAITRDAPVYAGVITWALTAVADGMKKRITAAAEKDTQSRPLIGKRESNVNVVGLDGAATQYTLARAGAIINGFVAAYVTGTMRASSGGKSFLIP